MSSKFETHMIAIYYPYFQFRCIILYFQCDISVDLVAKAQPLAAVGAVLPPVWITVILPKTQGYAFRLCVLYVGLIVLCRNAINRKT